MHPAIQIADILAQVWEFTPPLPDDTLIQCSLVCHLWRNSVIPTLFNTVHVCVAAEDEDVVDNPPIMRNRDTRPVYRKADIASFIRLLEGSMTISFAIRHLALTVYPDGFSSTPTSARYYITHSSFERMLAPLSPDVEVNLTDVLLVDSPDYLACSGKLKCKALSISYVHQHTSVRWTDMVTILRCFVQRDKVLLHEVKLQEGTMETGVLRESSSRGRATQGLTVDMDETVFDGSFLQAVISLPFVHNLKHLAIRQVKSDFVSLLGRVIRAGETSIETLEYTLYDVATFDSDCSMLKAIDLSQCRQLRELRIGVTMFPLFQEDSTKENITAAHSLSFTLSHLRSCKLPKLRKLGVEVVLEEVRHHCFTQAVQSGAVEEIDSVLGGLMRQVSYLDAEVVISRSTHCSRVDSIITSIFSETQRQGGRVVINTIEDAKDVQMGGLDEI